MSFLKSVWEFLFNNFMWLYIIMGLLSWIGIYPMTFQLFMFAGFLYCITLVPRFRIRSFLDVCVVLFLMYIFLNAIAIDYPHRFEMWKTELFYTLLPMSFYYIAKTTDVKIDNYIEKMIAPMTIVMIIGLVLYIYNPQWYTALKYAQLYDSYGYTENHVPEKMLREAFRLSSIWSSPYVIGYANGFFIIYLLKQLLIVKHVGWKKKKYTFLFLLSFIIMILAGFKALLLSFVLSILLFILLIGERKSRAKLLLGSVIIVIITSFLLATLDSDYFSFFVERFSDAVSEEGLTGRLEHTGGGIELNTLTGAGFGKYGMGAKNITNGWFIQDSQYQKVLAELGIVGFVFFVLLLFAACISMFKQSILLEASILITFMVSFIGSSSISAESTFPFVFWYALGTISRSSISKTGSKVQFRNGIIQNNSYDSNPY